MTADTYRGGVGIREIDVGFGTRRTSPFNGDPSTIFHCVAVGNTAGAKLTKVVAFYDDGTQTETVLNG